MVADADVIIAGGGLAGLTSAVHLSSRGYKVIIIDRNSYPRHKVCGEYVSNEVLPYLESLDIDLNSFDLPEINRLKLTFHSGKNIEADLKMGGFGISRYAFDHLILRKALSQGCTLIEDSVLEIDFLNDHFQVLTAAGLTFSGLWVLGAYGKRSSISLPLTVPVTKTSRSATCLAVKAHYRGNIPRDLVTLHYFEGGYCGVSPVEDGLINVCYIVDYSAFKKQKNLRSFQENVLFQNKHLNEFFAESTMVSKAPITIGQVSFEKKANVFNHMFRIGDSAGLIHPLCGNGMAIAIHSAKLISELLVNYQSIEPTLGLRSVIEKEYAGKWNQAFIKRLRAGRLLARVLSKPVLAKGLLDTAGQFSFLLPAVIKQTHGKALTVVQ